MKKLVMTMLTVLTCGAAFALPVGNPSEASLFNGGLFWGDNCGAGCDPCNPCGGWFDACGFRVGFYGDYVFNRHMRLRRRDPGTPDTTARRRNELEHTSIWTNAGYLAFNLCNRFDIFASLGTTKLDLSGNVSSFSPVFGDGAVFTTPGNRVEIETNDEFSWSVGARGTLWECGCTALGIEGQYFRTSPRVKRISLRSDAALYPTATRPALHTRYSEWQVGLGLSHRINILVPYVAVKWSGSKLQWFERNRDVAPADVVLTDLFATGLTLHDLRNKKHWGYAVGVSILACDRAAVTVEGRFADEKALYVNGQVRF